MDSEDLPIALTFSEQEKERNVLQKNISSSLTASRKKEKEIRKARHAGKISKNAPQISTEDEFGLCTQFDVVGQLQQSDLPDADGIKLISNVAATPHDPETQYPDSDEGYTGSDEADRLKAVQSLDDSHDQILQEPSVPGDESSKNIALRIRSRAGKRRRRGGRAGAFSVQCLDKTNIEAAAKEKAHGFFRDNVLAPTSNKTVDRVKPDMLIRLAKKRNAKCRR